MSSREQLASAQDAVGDGWGRIHPERWGAVVDGAVQGEDSFLDVGCSGGAYVARLRSLGHPAWGTDALVDHGWTSGAFVCSDGGALPFRDGSASVVFAFEVLEHVPDVPAFLAELSRVARRRVVLSVPNCATPSPLRQAGVTFHHYVDPTHVNFFTADSLASSIADAGLRVGSVTTFNPIRPEFLALASLGMSDRWAHRLARVLERRPRRRRFDMGLLATAEVSGS